MSDKQMVTKIPGKMNLLSSIKLKSIFRNPSAYNSKYSIKEQRLLQIKYKKIHFIRSTLNITNISLIDRNIQNRNNGDAGSDYFNNDVGDINNEAGDDNDKDYGDTNDDGGDDGYLVMIVVLMTLVMMMLMMVMMVMLLMMLVVLMVIMMMMEMLMMMMVVMIIIMIEVVEVS